MDKKKKYKAIFLSGILAMTPIFINKIIFYLARHGVKLEEEKFYSWRLGNIHYIEKGHGKPILLLHGIGIGSSYLEWGKNIEQLSKQYHVFAIDFLGFGLSDKPNTTYTAYLYATLINDFIKEVIKRPVAVIASSNAAAFAIMAYRLNTEAIKKMVLIEPTGIADKIATNQDTFFRTMLESPYLGTSFYTLLASKYSIKKFLKKQAFFGQEFVSKELIKQYYAMAHQKENCRYAIASFLSGFMNIDIKIALKDCKIPIYFIWGENAVLNPLSNMEFIEEQKPRSYYAIFEQTRLLPHYENSEEFYKLIIDFLH